MSGSGIYEGDGEPKRAEEAPGMSAVPCPECARREQGVTTAEGSRALLRTLLRREPEAGDFAQLEVFIRAMEVYGARNKRHQSIFYASGWRGALVDIRKKTDRLWNEFWFTRDVDLIEKDAPDMDSAIDLVNFVAFFVRQVNDHNEMGQWPWRNTND